MCRFLLVKSKAPIKPEKLLKSFSKMAKNSKTFDGDRQNDGWGISWLDAQNQWQLYKSLLPIWKDKKTFPAFKKSKIFLIHARSASFKTHKDMIEYNQPYNSTSFSYVFNGIIKGVALPYFLKGNIGAQKIWNLFCRLANKQTVKKSLSEINKELINHSRTVQALNIGVSDKKNIYALCYYSKDPDYYTLRYVDTISLKMICSESLSGYFFKKIECGEIKIL